jgi:hypothetical protein
MMPVTVGTFRKHSTMRKPRKIAGRKGWCDPPQRAILVALHGMSTLHYSGFVAAIGSCSTADTEKTAIATPNGYDDCKIHAAIAIPQICVRPSPQP